MQRIRRVADDWLRPPLARRPRTKKKIRNYAGSPEMQGWDGWMQA